MGTRWSTVSPLLDPMTTFHEPAATVLVQTFLVVVSLPPGKPGSGGRIDAPFERTHDRLPTAEAWAESRGITASVGSLRERVPRIA